VCERERTHSIEFCVVNLFSGDTHPDAKERHCVLSLALNFEPDPNAPPSTPPPPLPEETLPEEENDDEETEEEIFDLQKKLSLSSTSSGKKTGLSFSFSLSIVVLF
jgi:hypothetical protein